MERLTDFTLERYRLGELGPEQAAAVAARIAADPALAERLTRWEAEDRALIGAHPPEAFAGRIAGIARRRARARLAAAAVVTLAAAAALVAIVPNVRAPAIDGGEPAEDVRIKGPALQVFERTPAGSRELGDGERIAPGATVQLRLAGAAYGAVLSVDGRATVTVHWPTTGDAAVPLKAGAQPTAFRLDDVPDYERFFAVTSDAPFAIAPVADALRDAGPDADPRLPDTLTVHSLLLNKADR